MKLKFTLPFILLFNLSTLSAADSLSLSKAVEIALQSNLDLLIAANEMKQADNSNHAGNAGMLPQVSLTVTDNPSLTNISQRFTNGTTIERNNVLSNSLNAGLLLSYTLFDGRRMYAVKRKLEAMDQAAVNSMHIRMQQIIARVISGYSDIIRQNEYLGVLKQLQDLSENRLAIVRVRREAGLANQADVYFAMLDLDARKQGVLGQQAMVRNAYTSLNLLLNIKADSIYLTDREIIPVRNLSRTALDSLVQNNPEWLLASEQYNIALQTQKEIAAARLPVLRLSGAYNYNLSQSQAGFSLYNQSTGPQAGLTLSVPLFSGNVNRINLENAKLDVQNSEWRKEQSMQQIRGLFEQAWNDYSTAKTQMDADSVAVETASSYLHLMQERFRLAQSTIIELKEAQRTYEETWFRFISNRYIAKMAETQLLSLTGQLAGNR